MLITNFSCTFAANSIRSMKDKKALTLKTLNKSNVWEIQENDVFRLWEKAEKDLDVKDNTRRYVDVISSAFQIEVVKVDRPELVKKMEDRGFKIGLMKIDENGKMKVGLKKKPIIRTTDLTWENIRHISATKLIEVLERNFGGGWDSLPQSVQDIILHGFDVSTTTLPQERLLKPGGLYEKKLADGYEVLQIPKGTWVEAIFVKEKPEIDLPKLNINDFDDMGDEYANNLGADDDDEEDDSLEEEDNNVHLDEDEDDYDEDQLTEESYRTTFEEDPENLNLEASEMVDEDDY